MTDHTDFEKAQGRGKEVIDLTPTWSALVLPMAEVLHNPDAPVESRKTAEASLIQMARLADMYVGAVRRATNDTAGLTPDPDFKES